MDKWLFLLNVQIVENVGLMNSALEERLLKGRNRILQAMFGRAIFMIEVIWLVNKKNGGITGLVAVSGW
jgi:hypothetical protein